ncbi:hypothetical protein GALMADRAFT_774761 [Galerina marginata CBS 339.88]|uniref:Uncharacterized protein n=1 Tax=Galerina marginata (strain CBS 339.88) TaxID=685588 RepID=A0A067SME2_GALM3|nr:hypothetical protein GALMADRAFT_774761 [Galerina marginata CBS 339.88]
MKISANIVFIAAAALFSQKATAAPVVAIGRGISLTDRTEPLGSDYNSYIPSEPVADLSKLLGGVGRVAPRGL